MATGPQAAPAAEPTIPAQDEALGASGEKDANQAKPMGAASQGPSSARAAARKPADPAESTVLQAEPAPQPDATGARQGTSESSARDGASQPAVTIGKGPEEEPRSGFRPHGTDESTHALALQIGPTDRAAQDAASAAPSARVNESAAGPGTAAPNASAPATGNAAAVASPYAPAPAAVPIAGLAVEIVARARDGKNRFEIRLDPPELGRIDVHLHIDREGNVSSRLVVERSETLDLLRRDAPSLQRALDNAGLKTGQQGLEFSLRDQAFGRDQGNRNEAGLSRVLIPDEVQPVAATSGYGHRLGLGAGVDIRV